MFVLTGMDFYSANRIIGSIECFKNLNLKHNPSVLGFTINSHQTSKNHS